MSLNEPGLSDKTFVITGTMMSGGRDKVAAKIESVGGVVKNSVSKTTNYLVVGENAGGTKLTAADRHKVEMQLKKTGMLDYFEGRVFSGHEMPHTKPHPDVYLAAAHALGVDPKRCAVVEDTVTGATAGLAAGATVFGYAPSNVGHSTPDALREVGVALVFEDMGQLSALLAQWRPVDA